MTSPRPVSFTSAAAWLLGAFFLLSGVGKAMDMAGFVTTLDAYGVRGLSALAASVVALEMGLGTALVLDVQRRRMAQLSLNVLAVFTALFAYGYLVLGQRECGCFGAIEALALPPALSFARNAVLMALSAWLWRALPLAPAAASALRSRVVFGAAVLTLAGATLTVRRHQPFTVAVANGQAIRGSLLAPFVPVTASDSTYVVFLFSPACPHCWQATPVVSSYLRPGLADRIIALQERADSASHGKYLRHFRPPFALRPLLRDSLRAITARVPLAVVVRGGRVLRVLRPPLPPADSLRQLLAIPFPPALAAGRVR